MKHYRRYGMPYHTIKYFQDQAHTLAMYRGHEYAVNAVGSSLAHALRVYERDALTNPQIRVIARDIAHSAISLAALDPMALKALLDTYTGNLQRS